MPARGALHALSVGTMLLLALTLGLSTVRGAENAIVDSVPASKVTLRAGSTDVQPPPAGFAARASFAASATATADIQVTYNGFPEAARTAFEAAVTVWESAIVTPRVIHVDAYWESLGTGTLGSAGPTVLYGMSDGMWYPAALAEALCNCQGQFHYEIEASFNSNFSDWYLGTDGAPPADKYDFFTVVLHELGHGLGFISSFRRTGSRGTWGFGNPTSPLRFDINVWSSGTGGNQLTNTAIYTNPSTHLLAELTDGSVYFGGSNVVGYLGGRARLYAPTTWSSGSSISHFDEGTFATGTANALMTPFLANGEVIHHPGPLTLALFRDMGWTTEALTTVPAAPTNVSATAGTGEATVSWSAPLNNGGSPITSYTVTSAPGSNTCTTSVLSCTVTGLANGTSYTFTVFATNSVGNGPASAPSSAVVPSACTSAPFSDVPTSHPFCAEIKWMRDEGISTGFADGTYRPSIAVTRQAMSAFMARLAGATLTTCTEAPFSDVPTNDPFCAEIRWMKNEGISTGFPDSTYRPSIAVTRQAVSAFLARLAGGTLTACATAPFSDVPTNHPFCAEIKWMKDNDISTGFLDGTYRPSIEVTRQAMSAFMARVSVLLP